MDRPPPRPTLHDVAARAGVSIATVSRVLNGSSPTRPETEARVRAAIRGLGFRPNRTGRELRVGQSHTVGVLLPSLSNPIFADSVSGIQDAARAEGWSVLIASSRYDAGREHEAVEGLLSHRVGGLILTVAEADASPTLDALDAEGLRYVLLYNQPTRPDRAFVSIDNVAAGRDAARALVAQGHRRLGMVAGRFDASDRSRLRHAGFAAALAEAGLPPGQVLEIGFDDSAATDALRAALARPDRPTGLFCSTDLLALRSIAVLRDLGLRVPCDVSVIGLDGIAVGALTAPSLASIAQPAHEMGRRAFHHLLRCVGADAPAEHILLPHRLRPGSSLGAAPPSQE
ncbi:LacI family DNA-binding transcriptional regulator [Rhodovastum atsumiense]|uniref:LacI family DNA-binding transcriptional regulator n=1 Tax=Rhodovastum atsumiense TaxID=504468 RepID=A0A5M6ILH0_9PROT|nr:LacI family DNA-binding transcriptional regulator [Rhodovastum atsumiense]KAA5609094.1 LacI family DNA-binding transcriptional regulator [Rhodovastum atsumiense]CAH2602152.1 LacI family DNA-binding transcriptional regulator [Rhodovastum atsumiense]